jgi:uncharacterized protein (DUF488 family)
MRAIAANDATFFAVGHSTHDIDHFLWLLSGHEIETLVDLRSAPYSKQAPQFNREGIRNALARIGIRYLYGGTELGGRPPESELYAQDGRVLYWKVAETERFKKGIAGLWKLVADSQVALLCSEEDPTECHRRLLVGRVLTEEGATLQHIRGDGRLEEEKSVPRHQRSLFAGAEEPAWKSIRSVLPRRAQTSSSLH